MKKMRIAFVTSEYITESSYDGGLANYLYRVAMGLKKYSHEPIIIVGSDKTEIILHDDIAIHRVNIRNLPLLLTLVNWVTKNYLSTLINWIWQSWTLKNYLEYIHKKKPINIIQYSSYMATALFRQKEIPSIVRASSLHSFWNLANGRKITHKVKIEEWLELFAIKNSQNIIAPSHCIANSVHKKTGKVITVVESPFIESTAIIDRKQYNNLLENKKYLLFFGTINLLKGVKTISDILPQLFSTYDDLYFVFIGKDQLYGKQSMMSYVLDQLGHYKDRVIYPGSMRHGQLIPFIDNAQAVVLPSRIDNLPNTCIEAMARGKIVIGTRGASFDQLIDDGENGFLCEIDNAKSLLYKIQKVLSLKVSEREKISIKAKERIKKLFPERTIRSLLDIYHKTIY